MNNIEFKGKKMRVGDAPEQNDATQVRKKEQYSGIGGASISNDLDDDNPNQYIHSQQSRQIFMQKLDGCKYFINFLDINKLLIALGQ